MRQEYKHFIDKFKPKLTTDDCYTPDNIYQAIQGWCCAAYGVRAEDIVRPFWPGADYKMIEYPDTCVVVDNPPFSIFKKIVSWYAGRGIRFFLFAPTLTALGSVARLEGVTLLAAGANIVFENGASVNVSFVTNMDDPDVVLRSEPELFRLIEEVNKKNIKAKKKQVAKLVFPDAVITGTRMAWMSCHGEAYAVRRSESCYVRRLDCSQNNIFGGGLLLSERAAAERLELSEREKTLQRIIGRK